MRIDELKPGAYSMFARHENSQKEFEPAKRYIHKYCSKALNDYLRVKTVLYRGTESSAGSFRVSAGIFVGNPRTNRASYGDDPNLMKLVDEKLAGAGFDALRHNSIFCTSDYQWTRRFGKTYVIFPRDGFEFTYSGVIHDVNTFNFTDPGVEKRETDGRFRYEFLQKRAEFFDGMTPEEFVNVFRFNHTNFASAVMSRKEVYIKGDYIAIDAYLFERHLDYLMGFEIVSPRLNRD